MQVTKVTCTKMPYETYKLVIYNDKSKLSDKNCRNSASKSAVLRGANNILASLILTILIQPRRSNPVVTLPADSREKHL